MRRAYMYIAYMSRAPKPPPIDTEEAFLATYDLTRFERPSVTVDVVILTVAEGALRTVLYERAEHPARGKHALPGGFVGMAESLDEAAARVLRDKAGVGSVFTEQLYTFGAPKRDPRGRIITVAYYALVAAARLEGVSAKKGARLATLKVPWSGLAGGPVQALDERGRPVPLAFDHAEILGRAVQRIRGKLDYSAIGYELLSPSFLLRELQDVHEVIRGEPVNKDSFRRRMLASGLVEPTGEREREAAHRPAELYRFVKRGEE